MHPSSSLVWRVALAAIILLALAARLVPGERTIDDAYITFRYARNLLAGQGFVYNPGQRVQGTTTPLYTLLMVAAKGALPPASLPALALITNALADAISVVVLAWLGKRALGAPWLGLAAALLWAISPMSVTFAIGGMETSVYVLLLLLTLAAYAGGRSRWSAFCCALATLTRPDALLLAVPLFAHMVWAWFRSNQWKQGENTAGMETRPTSLSQPVPRSRGRPFPWREVGTYLLALAPWIVFSTLYFGSPLAHSVVAKTAAYRLEPYSALVRLIQHYATPFFEHQVLGTTWVGAGAILYLFLSLVGGVAIVRRESRLLPLVVYPWIYILAFSLYNPLLFRWYLAPILPMYTLCILYGARRLLGDLAFWLQDKWPAAPVAARVIGGLLVVAAASTLLNAWTWHPDHGPSRPAPEMAWFKLEQLSRRATLDLMANQPVTPQARIAAADIGAIGYESEVPILDTLGLVSPEAAAYYPLPDEAYVIPYAVSTELILDERPDYLIVLEVYARNTLLRSTAFDAQYDLYKAWPTDIYGSNSLLVYRLGSVATSQGGMP
jgi:hypothetical protein